jgi:hypothetical protein
MQDGPIFSDVDLVPAKHGVDFALQAAFVGQLQKEFQSLVGDAILRIFEVDPIGFCGHTLAAGRIVCEKLTQMDFSDLLIVGFEGLPCRALDGAASGGWFDARCHVRAPFVLSRRRSSTGGILRGTHSRCRPAGYLEAALSVS